MEANGKIQTVQIAVTPEHAVSATIGVPEWWPSGHRAAVVLAHDVGANMDHPLLVTLQERLSSRGYLTVRFNFPFSEEGRKRPDPSQTLEKAYRGAVQALLRDPEEAPAVLIFAGMGLGAKVAAQVIASGLKADGLVCLGFPLHPAGKPSQQKADALFRIICPILFVQGSRDAHCRVDRLEGLQRRIGAPTRICVVEDADHELSPVKRTPRTAEAMTSETLEAVENYLARTVGS